MIDSHEILNATARTLTRWMRDHLAPDEELVIEQNGNAGVRSTVDGSIRRYYSLYDLLKLETVASK